MRKIEVVAAFKARAAQSSECVVGNPTTSTTFKARAGGNPTTSTSFKAHAPQSLQHVTAKDRAHAVHCLEYIAANPTTSAYTATNSKDVVTNSIYVATNSKDVTRKNFKITKRP